MAAHTPPARTRILDALAAICGHEHVFTEEEVFRAHGFGETGFPALLARPGSSEEIAEIVRLAGRTGSEIVPVGGGTRIHQVAGPLRSQLALSLGRLTRVPSFEADNLSITVEAGVCCDEVQERVGSANLQLPVPADAEGSTVGGSVAANSSSWKRSRYGAMADYLLGAAFISPLGRPVKTGGNTVKNVSGYDLTKLICGSWGTLGIAHTLTLKLVPLAEKEILVEQCGSSLAEAFAAARRLLAGSAFFSSCSLRRQVGADPAFTVIAALEGSSEFVAAQLAGLRPGTEWKLEELPPGSACGGPERRRFRTALKCARHATAVFDLRTRGDLLPLVALLDDADCAFDLDLSGGVLEFTLPAAGPARADLARRWREGAAAVPGLRDDFSGRQDPPLLRRLLPVLDPRGIMFRSNTLLGEEDK